MNTGKSYIFCYGTLMSYNPHSVMYDLDAKKINVAIIDDYQLYLNFGNFLFPSIVKGHGEGKKLFAEVWEVDTHFISYIDKYEQVDSGLYSRDQITVGKYTGFIYRMNKITDGMVPIKNNNWDRFIHSISSEISNSYSKISAQLDYLYSLKKKIKNKKKISAEQTSALNEAYNNTLDEYWEVCDKIKEFCK